MSDDMEALARDWWRVHPVYSNPALDADESEPDSLEVDQRVWANLRRLETAAALVRAAVATCPSSGDLSFIGTVLVEDAALLGNLSAAELVSAADLSPEARAAVLAGVWD